MQTVEFWTMFQAIAVTITLAFIAVQAYFARRQVIQSERAVKVERTMTLLDRALMLGIIKIIRRLHRHKSYVASGEAILPLLQDNDNSLVNPQSEIWDDVMTLYSYFLAVENYRSADIVDQELILVDLCGEIIRSYLLLRPFLQEKRPWAVVDFQALALVAQSYMKRIYPASEVELANADLAACYEAVSTPAIVPPA